jgi:ABC-2 type transport system permease protein
MSVLRDTATVYVRELRPTLYEPFSLMFNLVQPLVFLLLYGPLIGEVPGAGDGSPWQWFVPGILVMLCLTSTTASAGYNLLLEMQTGSHERLLVTPLSRSSLLVGRTLKEVITLLVQAVLIIALVMPFGFQLYPLGLLVGLLLLAVLGIGLGSLSYALAIAVKNQEWIYWMTQQTLLFPLLILSGMLLPLEIAPDWMRFISRLNPLTYIVEAERALFAGDFSHPSLLVGAASALVLAGLGLMLGIRAMRRAAA